LRLVDPGNIVRTGDANGLVTIVQVAPIAVVFTLPQRDLTLVSQALARGDVPVEIVGADGRTVLTCGQLQAIDNQIDIATSTIKLKATFANAGAALWPGQFVRTRAVVDVIYGATVVPTAAVRRGPAGTFVYLIDANLKAVVRPVSIAMQDSVRAIITEGIVPDDQVVTVGFAQLSDGKLVDVVESTSRSFRAQSRTASGQARPKMPIPADSGRREAGELAHERFRAIHCPARRQLFARRCAVHSWDPRYRALPVSSLPQVSFPSIQVSTRLPAPIRKRMAALVTAPLERQLGRIPALTLMTSTSTFGLSRITLQFDLARDIDGAVQDVQAAINAASSVLPRQLPYPPVYAKINPADTPILTFALTSKTLQLRELSDAADTLIAQRLSEVPGVGNISVQVGSGQRCACKPISRHSPRLDWASTICAKQYRVRACLLPMLARWSGTSL
jgi:hypothetical protein